MNEFASFVRDVHGLGAKFLRVPPVTQLLTGNIDPRWEGPIELVPIDIERRSPAETRRTDVSTISATVYAKNGRCDTRS